MDSARALELPGDALPRLARLRRLRKETLVAVLLDHGLRPTRVATIAVGEAAHVAATPREVFCLALRSGALALLIAHNHPSGDPRPSLMDIRVTERLIRAGEILGVEVVDHLIVARHDWYSFRTHGCWPPASTNRM
ncbi:MAG: hypothetical protein DLM67_12195 [Candidatus Nephthysia bennettiae]|uniref:JAB domain-containing protein n=1 Tax=Candidatus Nephthysia bennettiae TaxID=3127016 RepID=A0A934K7T6_9BACT|nr:JAB domain-containing protein [Candidatus Dormibacteraeota bacterium]PZR94657.1 MAG: hypothetical protein DLM67_12195 [Candidatus Dormibacteraeota bacterium]